MEGQAITYEQFERLLEQNARLVEAVSHQKKTMDALLERIESNTRAWYTPDQALEVLGFTPPTRNARRRLKYLRDRHLLTKFGSLKPFTYDAEQVKEVADMIRAGRIAVPTKY